MTLYIRLTIGLYSSITTFSGFILDFFLALSKKAPLLV